MKVLALDVGTIETGYCIVDSETRKPLEFGKIDNYELLEKIRGHNIINGNYPFVYDVFVYEQFVSYGMPIGSTTLEAIKWNGRFIQANIDNLCRPIYNITRIEERRVICNSVKSGDTEVKHALIERFAPKDSNFGKGTKKNKGFFYGFSKDMWSAYAVATTYLDLLGTKDEKQISEF
jgi:hypothetical protein